MSEKNTILVVEDDEKIREPLCAQLEAAGFDVTCCDNGIVALDSARVKCFAAVITDYGLPGLNGAEIARALRLQCPATFIVGISAGRKEKDFLSAGTDVFLPKPFFFRTLIDLVQQRLKS